MRPCDHDPVVECCRHCCKQCWEDAQQEDPECSTLTVTPYPQRYIRWPADEPDLGDFEPLRLRPLVSRAQRVRLA